MRTDEGALAPRAAVDADDDVITLTEAARRLRMSRARVAEYVLMGDLTQIGNRVFSASDVATLAKRTRTPKGSRVSAGRRTRLQEMTMWLLSDWGGTARMAELCAGVDVDKNQARHSLRALRKDGYVTQSKPGQPWELSQKGWAYVKQHPRP